MACMFMSVSITPKISIKPKAKIKKKENIKGDILFLLNQMNYSGIKEINVGGKLLMTGTNGGAKIELMFNESGDQFVLHHCGVPSHDEEHKISDKLLEGLETLGWDAKTEHFHDKPKIPDVHKETKNVIQKDKVKIYEG